MKKRYFNCILAAVAAALSATSCVYSFNPEIPEVEERLVIEGDILIGEYSTFKTSYVSSLDSSVGLTRPSCACWIEGEDGRQYKPRTRTGYENVEGDTVGFTIDMRKATSDQKYRLHVVNHKNNHEYVSDWLEVRSAPTIDSLSYTPEPDESRMAIGLSMHDNGSSYFRWSYSEEWEYHTYYFAEFYYIMPRRNTEYWNNGYGVIRTYPDPDTGIKNTYYCWDNDESSEIMIFSTADQTDDRFVDLEFHTIPRSSKKLQIMYYIEVKLEGMSEDAYKYWNNISKISDYQGGIFAPNPSEMRGNITCITDPNEAVTGYINAAERSTAHLYIDNNITNFYKAKSSSYDEPVALKPVDYKKYYMDNYIPVSTMMSDDLSQDPDTTWVKKWCADCRTEGGTKDKPKGWPTDHE